MSNEHDIVIVVDDDVSVRISLARLFASASQPCKMFASAEDFLANVDRSTRGCAILDVHLPGMSGLDLQSIVARQYPNLSVAIISAFEDDEAEARALRTGAIAFLHKLFDPSALLDLLKATREKSNAD
jgi:FixJ family two-component response regulator